MSTKKNPSQPWKLATGHRPHLSGSGLHDPRPRGLRDRHNIRRDVIARSARGEF